MCFRLQTVSKFSSPTLIFLLSFLFFYNWFFSQKNVFSFKSIFVVTYIKTNFNTKSVFATFARCRQHVSRDQTVSQWNEGATSRDTTWQTEKCRYTSSVFIKSTSDKKNYYKNKTNIFYLPTLILKSMKPETRIFFLFGLSCMVNETWE